MGGLGGREGRRGHRKDRMGGREDGPKGGVAWGRRRSQDLVNRGHAKPLGHVPDI